MPQAANAEMPNCSSDWQSDDAHSRETGRCVGLGESAAYEFAVSTEISIQMLMRILNFFAQQDVTPCQVSAEASQQTLNIHLHVEGMSESRAHIVLEKMRSLSHVISADLSIVSRPASGAAADE